MNALKPLIASLIAPVVGAVAGAGDAPRAGAAVAPRAEAAVTLHKCALEYERSSEVGAIYHGANATLLGECLVRVGDRVKAGQVLGRLQNKDLEVDVERNRLLAENTLDIQIAENKHSQLSLKVKRLEPLVGKNFMSKLDYDILKLEQAEAALEVSKAKYTRSLAELQRKELAIQLQNRDFRAPHDGVVAQVFKQTGERVLMQERDPVFVVVDDSQLLAVAALDLADAWRVKAGCRVRVTPEIDGVDLDVESETFEGEVISVDQRIDPATRTCKLVARVPNRGVLLRSGLEVRMEIAVEAPPIPAGPAAGAAARGGAGR